MNGWINKIYEYFVTNTLNTDNGTCFSQPVSIYIYKHKHEATHWNNTEMFELVLSFSMRWIRVCDGNICNWMLSLKHIHIPYYAYDVCLVVCTSYTSSYAFVYSHFEINMLPCECFWDLTEVFRNTRAHVVCLRKK